MTVIVLATFAGAVFQRIAGIGFAMMLAPFMVVLLGPHGGVLFVNLLGAVAPAMIIPRVRSRIDPVILRRLVIPAVVATVPGVLLTLVLPTAPMSIAVGLLVIVGLGVAVGMRASGRPRDGSGLQYATGAAAGLTSAVAGVGGPALTAYALVSRWDLRTFAATIQPFFVVIGVVGFGMKLLLDPAQMPELPWWGWVGSIVAIVAGIWVGEKLEPHLPDRIVRILVIVIGFIGAALALVQGVLGLLA
ncbi:TSUP family transporter [Micrococcus terreus]|uniref:TSUP family transporter n=1 Tax=Micrococcus terreus TaxID=574650 RepID=UPI003D720E25